jgi:hypothetical protein
LKKLLGIVDIITENLKVLIISMPADCTLLDTYYARRLCQAFSRLGGSLHIFFIKHEDKVDLISRAFTRERKTFTKLCEVKVSLSLSEGTLLYSWGSANRGKLGLS